MSSFPIIDIENILNIKVSEEYKQLTRDLYKATIIYISIYILCSFVDTPGSSAIKVFFTELFIFSLLALAAYHLVIKKIVEF